MSVASAPALSRRHLIVTWISCTGSYCIANATWWMQPVMIDQLVGVRGLSATGAGLVVSGEMTAMALTSYLLAKVLTGGRFLTLGAVGIAIALLGSALSLKVQSFPLLVVTRCLTGFGEGFSFLVANTAIICFSDRDRAFANMVVANVLFGVALVGLQPMLPESHGVPSSLVALLIALALMTPTVFLTPPSSRLLPASAATDSTSPTKHARRMIALLCATTFIIGLASGIMWSFYGIIGKSTGLSDAGVNGAIATSILTAIIGSSAAAAVGNKWGRVRPVTIALALMTVAIVWLSFHPGPWGFRIATALNISTLYFIMPYLFAAGSVQDETGLGATYVGSAFLMTGAVSPFLGGILVDTVGTEIIGIVVVATSILSWFLFAYVQRQSQDPTPVHLPSA